MSILEIMFLIVAAMFVVGIVSQALVDLTGMGRFDQKDDEEED
jgi:hypothetical protein